MTPTRTLSGLRFQCPSPSVYCLEGLPLAIMFYSRAWFIVDIRSGQAWHTRPFDSVAEAAETISQALKREGVA